MIKAIPILLLLFLFMAPLPQASGDIPFGIDLKELERPRSAVPDKRERDTTRKERSSGKKLQRAGQAAPTKSKIGGYLRYTVKPGDHVFKKHGEPSGHASETRPTAPPAPSSRLPAAAPPAVTLICPVPEQDSAATVDSLLALLQIAPGRNKTLEAGQETGAAFSITVDRYFEYQGGRYVVSIGASDPSAYTLLRLLEAAGYKVLRLTGREDYRGAAVRLLTAVGVAPDFGRHPVQEGKGITGFLLKPEDAGGRRVVVSAERVGPGEKWLLAPGCGAR